MKPVYTSLSPRTGSLNPGLYLVQYALRQWLAEDPIIDFSTGAVTQPVAFVGGRGWLTLEFTPDSYDYDDKPKSNRGGPYREITFSGLLNSMDAATLQVLQSADPSQLILVLHDRQKRKRIVGNTQVGMTLSWGQSIKNASNGTETIPLTFTAELEQSPPFYMV